MGLQHMQIGEVASQTGLSLRTIRYYEEMGLVVPSARSAGGFRLYTDADVARLQLIKRMKPLEFSLEEMRDLLEAFDVLAGEPDEAARGRMVDRLEGFREAARGRVEAVRTQLAIAEGFAHDLDGELARHGRSGAATD